MTEISTFLLIKGHQSWTDRPFCDDPSIWRGVSYLTRILMTSVVEKHTEISTLDTLYVDRLCLENKEKRSWSKYCHAAVVCKRFELKASSIQIHI